MPSSVSAIRRGEFLVGRFRGFWCKNRGRDQDAIAESRAGARSQSEIKLFLAIAENFLAQRIGGEEPVASCMPVCGKAGISRVIENRNGNWLVANHPTEVAPAASSAPCRISLLSFTGQIRAVDAGVVQLGDRGCVAAGVAEHLRLVGRNFKRSNDAQAEHAVFFVRKRNFLIERLKGSDAVHASKAWPAAKNEMRALVEQYLFLKVDPVSFHVELAILRTTLCGHDRTLHDGAHFRRPFRRNRVGIVPKIQSVYVLVVEPQTGVMRMIDAFAGPRFERITTRDDGASRS